LTVLADQYAGRRLNSPNDLAYKLFRLTRNIYIDNWDEKKKIIMRYEVNPDGILANGKVFFDMTSAPGEDALDGMKI
jgi:gluconolactonase